MGKSILYAALVSVSSVLLAGCNGVRAPRSLWPPDDFRLEVKYAVWEEGKEQVRQSALILADGLVVYREADLSLRSLDATIQLPIYRRLCVYRLAPESIRSLSRELDSVPVLEVQRIVNPPTEADYHSIEFRLTYKGNEVDLVLKDVVPSLANRVLGVVNGYLPAEHGITMPRIAPYPVENRVQDVPDIGDSVEGALDYHRRWLAESPADVEILGDTFALACVAQDWEFANACLEELVEKRPEDGEALRQVLRDARGDEGAGSAWR